MSIFIYSNVGKKINELPFEVVETKGKGHPDNICDTLAERISAEYSNHCLKNYGVILRHMIDKLSILGGGSKVYFGKGEMVTPIRLLVNGRFTSVFNNQKIDYMKIIKEIIISYFNELFPLLDTNKYLVIVDNTHHNEGPGVVFDKDGTTSNEREKFFEVVNDVDVQKHNNHFKCNDTSTTVSYFPMSNLELAVLNIEQTLNSKIYKEKKPWVGSDIKVMGIRKRDIIEITSCVPLIAKYINNLDEYKQKIKELKLDINNITKQYFAFNNIQIYLNTRDDYEKNDLYLTAIGSAVESGDEGVVGRGNRSRGVIPFSRNFSMEAACGKNPVYHTGKLFTAIGDSISEEIFNKLGIENVVYCTSKMGDPISAPWNISVQLNKKINGKITEEVNFIVNDKINNHNDITKNIIKGKIKINSY